jgi:ACS family glucarate transporter-like MFS transporter
MACLFAFSLFGYIQRTEITIVGESMMRDLGLSQVMFGWLLTVFLIGYSAFQVPGAILGEYLGARRTLTWIGVATLAAAGVMALTPRLPDVNAVMAILVSTQLLLGIVQATLFPVASGTIRNWFPARQWGFAQGLIVTGLWVGSAVTPPLMSALVLRIGWRAALGTACALAVPPLVWWCFYARDTPAQHPAVSREELAELGADKPGGGGRRLTASRVFRLLVDPRISLVTISYFLMNYVFYLVTFWSFIYLRQERHLSLLESGWLASLPFLTAALASAAGGRLGDYLIARFGSPWGARFLAFFALPGAGLFLWLTGAADNAYLAVASLCLAFGCCEIMEGTYWSTVMRAAPADTMTATAVLNTGGNLGGVVATPAIAALSANHQWASVFAIGTLVSLAAAAVWFWIDIEPIQINEVMA